MTVAVFVDTRAGTPSRGPVRVEEPPLDLFPGLRSTWTGPDGDVWDLSDPLSGVVLLDGPIEGLLWGPHERFTSTSPGRAGSRFRGVRALERPVFWTIGVYSDVSAAEWLNLDTRFGRSLDRTRPGTWTVYPPVQDKTTRPRELRCRFVDLTERALQSDPFRDGWLVLGLELVADEQPFWEQRFEPLWFELEGEDADRPFIPEDGAPDFFVGQSSTITDAAIENPGDVEAWLRWHVEGSAQGLTVGVGGDTIGVQLETGDGDKLLIDSRRQSATLNGSRVRGILSPHEFSPVPARSRVPLNITATGGSGRVGVDFVSLHEKAWG